MVEGKEIEDYDLSYFFSKIRKDLVFFVDNGKKWETQPVVNKYVTEASDKGRKGVSKYYMTMDPWF